jgi:hypothetical protein
LPGLLDEWRICSCQHRAVQFGLEGSTRRTIHQLRGLADLRSSSDFPQAFPIDAIILRKSADMNGRPSPIRQDMADD